MRLRGTITLGNRFDDLDIGSLELAELLLRVQNAIGVGADSQVLAVPRLHVICCMPSNVATRRWASTAAWSRPQQMVRTARTADLIAIRCDLMWLGHG